MTAFPALPQAVPLTAIFHPSWWIVVPVIALVNRVQIARVTCTETTATWCCPPLTLRLLGPSQCASSTTRTRGEVRAIWRTASSRPASVSAFSCPGAKPASRASSPGPVKSSLSASAAAVACCRPPLGHARHPGQPIREREGAAEPDPVADRQAEFAQVGVAQRAQLVRRDPLAREGGCMLANADRLQPRCHRLDRPAPRGSGYRRAISGGRRCRRTRSDIRCTIEIVDPSDASTNGRSAGHPRRRRRYAIDTTNLFAKDYRITQDGFTYQGEGRAVIGSVALRW